MKRACLYLFLLAGLIIPCYLSASDIAIIGNIPTDSLIDSIALSPGTGTAFGIDKEKKCLYIIDVNSHLVTKKVSLGRRPVGIAVNPSNNLAYVTLKSKGSNHKKSSLCTVDSSGTVLNTFSIHGDPHGIAVNPVNNTVVIALEKDKKLLLLSADTMQALQEIKLPFKPRLVALDTDSNRAVVTAGKGEFSWWQNIIMIVDLNTGTVTNTVKLRRGIKGIAVDTGKDIAVTTGLKEINLFDIDTGSILSTIREGDNFLSRLKLKGVSDGMKEGDKDIYDEEDIDTDINRFLDRYLPEIDDAIVKDLRDADSGLPTFQTDYTYGLDINQSTHIAVISGEDSLLLLDMNTNTLNGYSLDDIRHLRAVAVDKYRNTALISYLKNKNHKRSDTGVLEVQLPNPEADPPEISITSPQNGAVLYSSPTDVTGTVDGNAVSVHVNGIQASISNNTFSATAPLEGGDNIITAIATDQYGRTGTSSITVILTTKGSVAGTITNAQTGIAVSSASVTVTDFLNNTYTAVTDINGGYSFDNIESGTFNITITKSGYNQYTYIGTLSAGQILSVNAALTVLNPAPVLASISPASVTSGSPGFTLSLTGSNFISTTTAYFNNSPVPATFISSSRIDIAVSSGAITSPGTYPVKVSNAAPGGGVSGILNFTVNPASTVEPLPEGSYGKQYEDLIPPDATIESYDTKRFSIITGLIKDRAQNLLPGITVSIKDHPEYGTKRTDVEGRFSIPAEGGGFITVIYRKTGFITSHRQVEVGWNNVANVENVIMIPEDTVATAVTFDGNPATITTHKSSVSIDEFGSRSLTMVFAGDNRAFVKDANGNEVEITSFTTRATEFDTPESMPAKLPPNSAYTYCSELTVDGAKNVRFEKPVTIYVENFLGFNVGEIVPVGYYDRDRGVWVPSDNGKVIKLLDTNSDGIADAYDNTGDGNPDGTVTGLNDPAVYTPGKTYWRVELDHFTPIDCNWPFGFPPGASGPNGFGDPNSSSNNNRANNANQCTNSYTEGKSGVFHEDIPIAGTDMTLHYASDRVKGYKTVVTIPASGPSVPSSLKNIIVQMNLTGRNFETVLAPLANQKAEFAWDGLDYLGRTVNGTVVANISIGYVYNGYYYSARSDVLRSFAQAGTVLTGIRGRQEGQYNARHARVHRRHLHRLAGSRPRSSRYR